MKLALMGGAVAGASRLGMFRIAEALAATKPLPPVIWLQGQSCSGCSVSVLNATYPDIAKVITEVVSLKYHMTIMGATGHDSSRVIEEVVSGKRGKVVLVVEGAIPTTSEVYCTLGEGDHRAIAFSEVVLRVARASQAALAFGTCAAYGGIPGGKGNTTGAIGLSKLLADRGVKVPVINVPGCPPHPDWMVGTIAHYIWYGVPRLDEHGRPKIFYPSVHENCERYSYFQEGKFAKDYGEPYCLYELGCKGPISHCDVMRRGWNGGVNNCISCGSPCIGCTEPTFPDHEGAGLRGVAQLEDRRVTKVA